MLFRSGADIEGMIASQFGIILPNGMQSKFTKLFEELEERKAELRIDTFGIERKTLEQVFTKVTNDENPEVNLDMIRKINEFLEIKAKRKLIS